MLRREDRNLMVSGKVLMARNNIEGQTWRGIDMPPGSSVIIPDVLRFQPFRAWPDECGWLAAIPPNIDLQVAFYRHGTDQLLNAFVYREGISPINLPWPKVTEQKLDLKLDALPSKASRAWLGKTPRWQSDCIFVANHKALSRKWLIKSATGTGVEIGPGAQPQILPGEDVKISYLEQMAPKEWNDLYNQGEKYPVRPELWNNYIVGDAHNIPVPDGSLDFIFASHVFEHLANPIGHLKRWRAKLKAGGRILCIVPDLGGTKDAVQSPSTMSEWLDEYADDIWFPTPELYARYMMRDKDDKAVRLAIDQRKSIHVHYYNNINCQLLMDYAVSRLKFSGYCIEYTRNHKDFHFVLEAAS